MGLIDSIIGAESGGNPNATNPTSSASGLGQFIDSTWLNTIKTARPDLAEGKSDAELLALKTNPELSRQMTEAYATRTKRF
jgi:soluble lytic murein transglycosylase-like protein